MSHQWLASALCLGLLICAACAPPPASTPRERITTPPSEETAVDPYLETRLQMVERTMRSRGIKDERVLRVMETTPRHEFVPERYLNQAYADHPLPIGHGQTISQPYIVALMTELLQLEPGDKVLEIGTGSGYQAAVLAELVDEVYSVEIIPELAERIAEAVATAGAE